jgi:small subunit ribosomal protein S5
MMIDNRNSKGFVEVTETPEFEEKLIQVDRVTRVVKGGRRMRFRATVVVGNRNGKVGVGISKGNEVMTAVQKAAANAKKNMIEVDLRGTTIAHEVTGRLAGAYVFLKPASEGTGVIAGGAVRQVLEAAGVKDILSKMLGSNSKINNAYATILALKELKKVAPKVEAKTAPNKAPKTKEVEVEVEVKDETK